MNKHLSSKRITVAAAVAALALAGCGATLASTTSAPASGDPISELYGRLLVRAELPGFTSWNCPLVETDAGRWSQGSVSVEQLRHNGFAAGLKQTSHSESLGMDAAVSVTWFDSADGARSALDGEFAAARGTAFPVSGIPGARGFTLSDGAMRRYNVAFADGRYLHLVSVGFSPSAMLQPSREWVAAAATALYHRVHEQPRADGLTEKRSQFLR